MPIPNEFHFVFGLKKQTEPFHLCYYLCLESCRQINQPDKITFYYHHEPYGKYWELIKERLVLVRIDPCAFISNFRYGFKNRACKQYSYAHHSDFIRLQVLIEHGGVYADMDTLFVNKIPPHLYSKPFVLGREDDLVCKKTKQLQPSLCNAFIMSKKQSAFAVLWLERMESAFDGAWSNHSTLLPQRLSVEHPDAIHIEPSLTFYKYMWTPEGVHELLQGCGTDLTGVVSMHLWSHLWWSEKRTDFSDFHAGMLTEDHIRNVDTTYNLAARRFLPQG